MKTQRNPKRQIPRRRAGLLIALIPLLAISCSHLERSLAQPIYDASGTVKSFGPQRAYVNIAHEAIAGYMGAMIMSFEPGDAQQLQQLSVGQRVVFRFRETADARRIIVSIRPAGR